MINDDTNVERYSGEGVGYHHDDSKHGVIKGHNYVTEVCIIIIIKDTTYPVDFRLYMPEGSAKKTVQKQNRSRVQND